MKKKVVLFDIDYTLFDTQLFRKKLYNELSSKLHMRQDEIIHIGQAAYDQLRQEFGFFNPEVFIAYLCKELGNRISQETIEGAIWEKENFRDCFYKETPEVLAALSKETSIGIFSKGHGAFQKAKLSEIAHYFDEHRMHIHINKEAALPDILSKYKAYKLYLVDDALEVLHKAKLMSPDIFTIWVKRGIYASSKKPIAGFSPDATVATLRTIPDIINAN